MLTKNPDSIFTKVEINPNYCHELELYTQKLRFHVNEEASTIMEYNDLSKLCESLSLSGDNDILETKIKGDVKRTSDRKVAHSLVGKILTTKPINREAFISWIPKLWRTSEPFEINAMGRNIFVLRFRNSEDKRRVLSGGPWCFNDSIIALEEPKGMGKFQDLEFCRVSFRVQLHNLPLLCMNQEAGLALGRMLERVEEIDLGYLGDYLDKFLRIHVNIDISQPLKRALKVGVEDSDEIATIVVHYECLPELCFHYGILGHPLQECPSRHPSEDEGRPLKYGAWIRAGTTIGEEPRGKRPRGDGDQHTGGPKQSVPEPKISSWWKPKKRFASPCGGEESQTILESPGLLESRIVPIMEIQNQPIQEVDFEHTTNDKELTEIVSEDVLEIDSLVKAQNKEAVCHSDTIVNGSSLGQHVKGPNINHRGQPRLGVAFSSPYKK
ncbi:hypothetical protein EZV62_001316 [Acer yangbiense]|uniref:DUF4283 domain-containing protein n=1 Tax=Acer yangbiense TaxID=1000413 RepID=A0A5C7ITT0_9ROSI|nr:hypothetical protein EZV62_001316 [Acer yangbiense]